MWSGRLAGAPPNTLPTRRRSAILGRSHRRKTLHVQASTCGQRAAHRVHLARHRAGDCHHAGVHRRQCVLWLEGGADLCDVNSSSGDFDGPVARLQKLHHSRKQHRADGGIGGGHVVVHHFCAAGAGHHRLVDRLPLLGLVCDLRTGRHSRRDVFDPAAARAGHQFRFAVPGRRGLRRGAESGQPWRSRYGARCRGKPCGPDGGHLGRIGGGRFCFGGGHQDLCQRCEELFQSGRWGERV